MDPLDISAQSADSWELRRRALSHQELKNVFLLHAERLAKAQRLQNSVITAEVVLYLRTAWVDLSLKLKSLVEQYENACSPKSLLACMLQEKVASNSVGQQILSDFHEEWCASLRVREWSTEGSLLIDLIDRELRADAPSGSSLYAACRQLCDLLHTHPTRNGPV